MDIVLGMASGTSCGRALEDAVYMTGCTSYSGVFAIQVECKFRVIYCGGLPAVDCMTGGAIRSKLTLMNIILGMAGGAVLWSSFEYIILMAILTGNVGMFAIQLEGEFRMVNLGRFPTLRCMTSFALCAKLSFMHIILLMAGDTSLRGCF